MKIKNYINFQGYNNNFIEFICEIDKKIKKISVCIEYFVPNYSNKGVEIQKLNNIELNENYKQRGKYKDGIYICPFGQWNPLIIKYQEKHYHFNQPFIEPIPKNNIIYYIEEGKIFEKKDACNIEDFKSKKNFFIPFMYSFYGILNEDWYPLIPDNEYKDEVLIYFKQCYLNDKKNYLISSLNDLKNNQLYLIFKYIFEKPIEILESFKKYFPKSILSEINEEIEYILENSNNFESREKKDNKKLDYKKFNLSDKLYRIFKNKKAEIKKNNNIINYSTIKNYKIDEEIQKMNDKLYSYDALNLIKNIEDYNIKLNQDIDKIFNDISKSEKERIEDKENIIEPILPDKSLLFKGKEKQSILTDAFLISEENIEQVDKNTQSFEIFNSGEYEIQNYFINKIEINEIEMPKIYTINTITEFIKNNILNIIIFPSYITSAIIDKNQEKISKSISIFSDLYNLYQALKNHKLCLIAPIIEEYNREFEKMLIKLHASKLVFTKDIEENLGFYYGNVSFNSFITLPKKHPLNIPFN